MSTPTPMLPPADGPEARGDAPPGGGRLLWRIVAVVLAVGVIALLGALIPVKSFAAVVPGQRFIDQELVAQKPGSARPTASRVSIDADGIDEPDGAILFTTVQLDTSISIADWLYGEYDDDIDLRPRSDVLGDRSVEDNRERNLEMMRVSKDAAIVAALHHLGIAVFEETGLGIDTVRDDGPARGSLVAGDVIIAVDDVPITGFASLQDQLATKSPGELGVITVENIDTFETRDVELAWGEHPDRPGDAYIGVNVVPRQEELPLPFDIEIDSGSIGGPSAGLAFTLTILDLLTAGELTGGLDVAVTGTITGDGMVGPIGGVGQKAAAAREAGAAAFIVPVQNVDEAEPHAGSMPIIGVATLDDALAALASLGGETENLTLVAS
ncbi:MAG: S16 family serine protease [Acidimicrobiales bacterium]